MAKCTGSRIVVLRTLNESEKSWKELLVAYYGPERAQLQATTSFSNQLHKLAKMGMIVKQDAKYFITDLGREFLNTLDPQKVKDAKSEAEISYEIKKELEL